MKKIQKKKKMDEEKYKEKNMVNANGVMIIKEM